MSATGFTRHGLRCVHCQEPFALALARPELKPEALPDPFEAKCPCCQQVAAYPRTAIGVLVAVGRP
jgi:hypothetical protein